MAATAAAAPASSGQQEVRQTSLIGGKANTCNGPVTDKPPDQQQQQQQQQHKTADDSRPQARQVVLQRHGTGFGFVAGSEKPVVVRFVTEGGPSDGKLEPEDQILEINGEDVSKAPQSRVIGIVQNCKQTLKMTVCQPDRSNATAMRKSSLLTAAKKAKLKHNPSRVRFAEGVLVNGTNTPSIYSSFDSCVPFMPNVLKVFLENGQTKTFKYDTTTLVQDVLNSLVEKLSIKNPLYLSLCVEHVKIRRRNKLILLDPGDSLSKIANRPGAHNLRCLFRVVFVPKDISELLLNDPITFEYFYAQSCNDIVQERFAPELKYEVALRLSALHLLQHSIQMGMMTNNGSKVNLKAVERECTLKPFVPYTLIETMKCKELHKLLNHYMKQNQSQLCPPGQKILTAIQAKVHYLRIISELLSYGAKIFPMNIRETIVESALLVSRKFGLSHVANLRSSMPVTLARIEDIISVRLSNHNEFCNYVAVELHLRNNSGEVPFLRFALEEHDAEEFVLTVQGYHRLILTTQSPDLPYKDLPVFSDITQDSSNSWKSVSDAASHDAVKFDVSKDGDGIDVDEKVTRSELRGKNRRRASPPPLLYEQIAGSESSTGLNGKSSAHPLLCSSHENEKGTTDKESSSGGADRWLLRSAPPHNPNAPHPRSMSRSPPAAPAGDDGERSADQQQDMDLPSVVSMEILESAIIAEKRIKREEVEQRVAEMHRIVADAQHYLTETESSSGTADQDRNPDHSHNNKETQVSDDSESLKSDPDFTATDSLLLIRHTTTDERQLHLSKDRIACVEAGPCFSESDTTSDSYSNASGASPLDRTPNGSFKNQISVKRDCVSLSERLERTFSHSVRGNGSINGTSDKYPFASDHRLDQDDDESPDASESAPNLSDAENELIEALKRLQTEEECYLELPFMHNAAPSMSQDQEIIDLTAFPPPGEEEDQYDNLQHISGPVFHVGQAADPYLQDEDGVEYVNFSGPSSLSLVNHNHTPYSTLTRVTRNCLSSLQQQQRSASVSSSSSTACDDNRTGAKIASIDDFIASVSIPPPPLTVRPDVSLRVAHHEAGDNEEDEDDDLSSLIVPPPPVEEKAYPQDDVIAKFWQVTDDVKKIYETLPGRSGHNNHMSSNGLLQVSPKSGTRELHSSSSGDSGYDSIPVMPPAAASSSSSSCKHRVPLPAAPVACDSDAFTLRLVLSSASSSSRSAGTPAASSSASSESTKPEGGRLSLSTVCQSSESNNGNQIKGIGQREAAENGTCNTNSGIGFVRADAIPSSALVRPLPTTSIVSNCLAGTDSLKGNKDLVTPPESDLYSSSSADGLRRVSGKKIPPPPPVRSKPPIPPTSPSIIERRRQLAKKAQTKAKLGMMPVRESAAAGEEDEEEDGEDAEQDDSLMRMGTMQTAAAESTSSHELLLDAAIVFNEGRGTCAADQSQIFTDEGLDPSSCLLEQILDKKHFPSQQIHLHEAANAGISGHVKEWNATQENVMDSNTLFVQVQANIDQLLTRLEDVHETQIRSDPSSGAAGSGLVRCDERILNQRKDELVIESRSFVTSSKLFVKCATEGSPDVIDHLLDCLSLLDHMCKVAEVIVMNTESQAQVTCLIDRLKEVAVTFGYTIATVHKLTEQDITDPSDSNYMTKGSAIPSMSQLMNHATSLATSLSALMRTLRAFSSY